MSIFRGVTFIGINISKEEELNFLFNLQQHFSSKRNFGFDVEFGVLLSKNWRENGKRFVNPEDIGNLIDFYFVKEKHLNLCAHICGSWAREISKGEWSHELKVLLKYPLFKRIQLNISGEESTVENSHICRDLEDSRTQIEYIIQQKSLSNCKIFKNNCLNSYPSKISLLIDSSGGEGILLDIKDLKEQFKKNENILRWFKVGIAGGLGPHTAAPLLGHLLEDKYLGEFWIDMESKVRNSVDEFDYGLCQMVCQEIQKVLEDRYNNLLFKKGGLFV